MNFVRAIGKTPIVVIDSRVFYTRPSTAAR